MDGIQKNLLEQVAGIHEIPEGAYNIRANGALSGRNTTANIDIITKEDKQGIDIIIKPGTKKESVHIVYSLYVPCVWRKQPGLMPDRLLLLMPHL